MVYGCAQKWEKETNENNTFIVLNLCVITELKLHLFPRCVCWCSAHLEMIAPTNSRELVQGTTQDVPSHELAPNIYNKIKKSTKTKITKGLESQLDIA